MGPALDLLERAEALEELARLTADAASGRGRLALVGGEAGVGKTSLVRQFTRVLPGKIRLLWGGCDPLSLPRPLGPLVDVAPALGPAVLRLLDAEASRAALFAAVRDVLQTAAHVLVFEDVHWADDATLDLLRFLGRRLESTRSLLVATYRDDEVGPRHPLRVVLGDLASSAAARRISLPPLSPSAVRTLAAGSGIEPEGLHRRTGGNPFFVTEVLAAGGATMPPTLRDAVLARAARLRAPAREALEAAAVLGPRFDPLLLQELAPAGDAALEECLASGCLARDGAAIAFRHELAREAVLGAILPTRAAALHRSALRARRRRSAGPDDLATLAHHAEAAGEREAVLELAPAAARRAAALRSHREAAAQYARALRFADALAPEARAQLLEACSYECYLTNQIGEALEARQQALDLWHAAGRAAEVGESHRWLSRLSWFLGRNAQAESHAQEALQALEPTGDTAQLAWAQSNLAQLHMLAGRAADAVAWGERALAVAERLGEREVLTHALNNVGAARALAGEPGGLALLERSLALALELQAEEHVARAYTNLASVTVTTRQLAAARGHLQAGLGYSTEHDLDSWRLYMSGWLAVCHFWEGRFGEAARVAEEMLRHPRLAVPSRIQPLLVLGRVRTRRGDPGARAALDEALALATDTGELQRLGPVRAARAEAAWLAGDLARVADEAAAALELALARGEAWLIGELGYWYWRAGRPTAAPGRAAEPYALEMAGRTREAAGAWRALGCPYETAMALGALSDDEAALREAHALFEGLEARPMADRVARSLRERGVRDLRRRPRAATRAHPLGLTTRQIEVLGLVAEGLRDAQIAERLFVSPKTVGHHVSALLGKLGARTRSEAAARAAAILGPAGGGRAEK